MFVIIIQPVTVLSVQALVGNGEECAMEDEVFRSSQVFRFGAEIQVGSKGRGWKGMMERQKGRML